MSYQTVNRPEGSSAVNGDVPESLEAVDTAWVVATLRSNGHATSAIEDVRVEPLGSANSFVARIHLSGPVGEDQLPPTLFLKLCPSGHSFLGTSELAYYKRDYGGLADAPTVHCFAAVGRQDLTVAESLGAGYALLLADLTTGYIDNKLIEPTAEHAKRLGRALGRLHAHRWGPHADPEGPHNLDADLDRCLAHVSLGLVPVLDTLGDTIHAKDRDRLNRVFNEDVQQLRSRVREGDGLTLVHGDPNPTNVLTPRLAGSEDGESVLYLIDRQPFAWSLRVWLGVSDLVHASVPYWQIDTRRQYEGILLESYHAALVESGVADYPRQALVADWRGCLSHAVMIAIEWGADPASLDTMRWLWEAQLIRALAALEDWDDA